MTLRAAIAALALAVAAVPIAVHADGADWRPVDAETGQVADLAGLAALAEAYPDSGSLRLRLLTAQLTAGEIEPALASLRWLAERGYVFGEASRERIPQMVGDAFAEQARAALLPLADALACSEVVAVFPAEAGLVESVLAPGTDGIFVATSVSERGIWFSNGASTKSHLIPGAGNISGIVSDTVGNMGWLASGAIDGSDNAGDEFAGLIGLTGDLENPILVAAPDGVNLSDLHLADDRAIYASDPLGGGIYRMLPGARAIETLIAPGTFRSPQGLATSADGKLLYVSDYRSGIAVVDLASSKVSRLASDVPVILDGTDGLWRLGNRLIAIQNGTSPMRISAFTLSDDGFRIVAAEVLERANPEWTEPLSGSISGDALYYVGNGQWDKFDAGKPVEGRPVVATQIRRLEL